MEDQQKMLEESLTKILSAEMGGIEQKFETVIEAKFKKTIEDLGLDKLNFKHSKFPIAGGEDEKIAKAERNLKFVKYVFQKSAKDIAESFYDGKDLSGVVDSDGGFLVPSDFYAEVQRITNAYGIIRKYAQPFPMSSDRLDLPTGTGSVSLAWQGVQGQSTNQTSSPKFGNVQLLANTLIGITVAPKQFLSDVKIDIMNYLMMLFAEEFAGAEDYQGLRGSGTPFIGILNKIGVPVVTMSSGNTAFTNITVDNLRDMITKVPVTILSSCAFTMHREVWGEIQKQKQNNQNIVTFLNPVTPMSDLVNFIPLQPVGTVWGFPVLLSDKMPALADTAASTDFVTFGSYRKGMFFGDREAASMYISEDATIQNVSMMETVQSAVRFTERVAMVVGLPTAFCKLRTAAS